MINLLKPFSFLPALLMMYMIYSFSADSGTVSSGLSYKVSEQIVVTADKVLDLNLGSEEISYYKERINYPVRKAAHMTEYACLAVAIAFPLYVYGVRGIGLMILTGTLCVSYAMLDEYHQSFVAGRVASPKDVAIDSIGVICGVIIVRVVGWTGRMTIFRPRKRVVKRRK
ncbi:VanZ family protein [Konateibacter massiliensis]|uniref:VanZ family protein n=1 Tax=Konateibacter massiliensis TaxID=2002841 RepID=UPI001F3E9917|nr:VanZ family protein [Konateibacter massiliensis]